MSSILLIHDEVFKCALYPNIVYTNTYTWYVPDDLTNDEFITILSTWKSNAGPEFLASLRKNLSDKLSFDIKKH